MKKLDLRKELKYLYAPRAGKPAIIQVPNLKFIMIDGRIEAGKGPGNSPDFAEAMGALYGLAYTLKFASKLRKKSPIDYPVMALEGLWWVADGSFDISVKDNWLFTVMILQPDHVSKALFDQARKQLVKKRGETPALRRARLQVFREGTCVQMLHVGPYATEPQTVAAMRAFATENGYRDKVQRGGKHHEIYMGDPRRVAPEKLKTVLRHPVERA